MKSIFTFLGLLFIMNGFGQMYILNEDFATATGITPPVDWQNNTIIGQSTDKWHFDNPGNRTINYPITAPFAIFDAQQVSPDTALEVVSLETPYIDASVGSYCLLFFDHYFFSGAGASGKILAYNGTSWVDVISYTSTSASNPTSEVIDLTAICAGHTNAKLRFQWEGHGEGYWAIDNVRIYAPLFLDAGISAIDNPVMPFSAGIQDVKVTLKNFGYQTITTATIRWSVNGVLQTPFSWSGSIPFGSAEMDVNIGSYAFQPGAVNQMKIWSDLPNGNPDPNRFNDSTIRSLNAALCGTYTIGGISPNFQTFNEAVSVLTNTGISCPVVFKVRDGTYYEQIEINPIPGSSTTNTVTFESESGDSSQVLIWNQGGVHTFKLIGSKNIIFSKLSIKKYYYSTGSIVIGNSSENIVISNCKIISVFVTDGIRVEGGSKNIFITNNFFYGEGGSSGVVVSNVENIQIYKNIFQGYSLAAYGSANISNLHINENEASGCGIDLSYTGDSVYITNNRITVSNIKVTSGESNRWCFIESNRIATSSASGIILTTKNCLVANNYISIFGNNPWNGIQATNCNQTKIVFNSINLLNSNIHSKCILLNGGSSVEIQNNIFSNPGGGYSAYILNNPTSCSWDYNNYYNLYKRVGFLNDSTYQSFSSWTSAINGESNGLSVNPFFQNDSILIPHQILLNNSGLPISEVLYDIDSTIRQASNPDIGAKEFSPCELDAGINAVSTPTTPAEPGLQDVKVILQNQGTLTLTSVTINWSVNGILQSPVNWLGSLTSAQNSEIIAGTYTFLSGTIYHIIAWTSNPNNGVDCDMLNDKIVPAEILVKLCGTYTIGGSNPNFQSFNEAVSALTNAGITCPVVFKVRNGNYYEQIEINPIPGSSTTNTVTFESESGDSSQVLVWNQGAAHTFKLIGSKNIIFSKLSIKKYYYSTGSIVIGNSSENISIFNCQIISIFVTNGIRIEGGAKNVRISHNFFNGGDGNMGVSISNAETIQISKNIFRGYSLAAHGSSNISNLQINDNDASGCGFDLNYTGDSVYITNNRITVSNIKVNSGESNRWCFIEGNRIATSSASGIILTTKNCLVANNYISIFGINPWNGIQATNCSQTKIVFNSINLLNNNINSKCILLDGGSSVEIKNNIFSNPSGGYSAYVLNNPTSCSWDYNNYYNLYKRIGFLNDSTYISFSSWTSAINGESNGLSVNPFFQNDSILVPHQILLNNSGLTMSEVLYDIDSTIRQASNPDIGAKEFSPCELDAGINAISTPTTPAEPGLQDVKVILQNQGTLTLTSVTINWSVNGILQSPVNWSGSIITAQNLEVIAGTYTFLSGTIYHIIAWTSNPNNGVDCDMLNDKIVSAEILVKLCGTYTIGGSNPNFQSFNEAVSALTNAGITCPVVFKVRNGNYYEQIEINPIPGSSIINTVTFESESGDSSQVIIWNQPGGGHTFKLIGSKNIIFSKLSIKKEYYSTGSIVIGNSSENILISHCKIISVFNTNGVWVDGWSKNISIINNFFYGEGGSSGVSVSNVENNHICKNRFQGYGLSTQGSNVISNLHIDENKASGCGFNLNYSGDSVFITNNVITEAMIKITSSTSAGCLIQGNIIMSSVSSGITLTSKNCMVANNYISIFGSNLGNGIDIISSNQTKIVFNSINVLGNNVNSSKCLKIDGGNALEFKNNIFMNSGAGFCIYTSNSPINSNWDYNNYYSPSNNIGFMGGTTYSSFSSWASAIGGEASGRNLDPYFANDSSYKVYQRGLNGAGIPVPGVLFDIEDKIRNDQAPDIGAWEFMVDFGITQVLHPTLTCSQNPNDSLTILIRQFGDVPFTDIRLAYKINNEPVVYDTIIGTIYNDIIYTFKQRINITSQGNYTIKCWLVENIDDNVHNDTITVQRYSYPAPVIDFSYQSSCENLGIKLTGTATVLPPFSIASYEWYFGDGDTSFVQNPTHLYPQAGVFTVTFRAYNNMGCYNETTKTITVEEYDPLQLQLTSKDETCNNSCNGEVDIVVTGGEAPIQRYFNNELITQDKVSNLCTGDYPVRIVDNKGCEILTNVVIKTESPMTIGIAADPVQGYAPLDVNLSAPGTGAASREWYYKGSVISRDSATNITIAEQGTHTFILRTSSGPPNNCLLQDSVKIEVVIFVEIIIPNAFTPNDDGYNDTFGPVTKGIGSLEMNISDRNGRFVHKIDSVNGRWDGNMPSGTKAPRGVYYYLLTAMGYDNQEYVRQGNVNLYRDLVDITPNPVKTKAVLDLSGTLGGSKTIAIYAASGLPVKVWTTPDDVLQLDLSFLEAGFYILKASDSEQVILVKFIKE